MRAISWNVNSLRTRFERVAAVMDRHQPDLICLQETKVTDDDFPHDAIEELGYIAEVHGQKTYNGVALISRDELEDVRIGFDGDPCPEQARVISGVCQGIRFINVYVVNGKEIGTDKYELKMKWLTALRLWIATEFSNDEPLVILGDFNIVPEERDAHDPEKWRNIHFSPEEVAQLDALRDWGTTDLFRLHNDEDHVFSWWDYRKQAFRFDNGLRIDLAMGTARAVKVCSYAALDRDERKKGDFEAKPSDHIPLILDFF